MMTEDGDINNPCPEILPFFLIQMHDQKKTYCGDLSLHTVMYVCSYQKNLQKILPIPYTQIYSN